LADRLSASRRNLVEGHPRPPKNKEAAEGGCGVIGLACSEPVAGRHLLQSLTQMRNRGNGKGGGIAAVGLVPEQFGVTREILDEDYMLMVAYLDPESITEVEERYVRDRFDIHKVHTFFPSEDLHHIDDTKVRPPVVYCYFVRPKASSLERFCRTHDLEQASPREIEDEFVYQNTYLLNQTFYADERYRAFVLSHGKNQIVLKMVGYGDDVVRYYKLEDLKAHVWIGHHRYPTKGKVWHPGGAHPFIGLNESLVHNGDFANYASVAEYLSQRNIYPMFQTDTEVSALVFDLHHRTYGYPLEYVMESLAPTTERDFTLLPPEKQSIYAQLQRTHIHGSPDGPWFFLIAQNDRENDYRLIGITDTSMLRPQVFALQEGQVSIGFAASEKQGIDAALKSLAAEDDRFWQRADRYWNARGGSHTDGGAFLFDVVPGNGTSGGNGSRRLVCTNKFGQRITTADPLRKPYGNPTPVAAMEPPGEIQLSKADLHQLYRKIVEQLPRWNYGHLLHLLDELVAQVQAGDPEQREQVIGLLTLLMDRRYDTGKLRRSSLLSLVDETLVRVFTAIKGAPCERYRHLSRDEAIPATPSGVREQTVIIDAEGYPQEDLDSLALQLVACHEAGYRNFIIYNTQGHRFIANGLGQAAWGTRFDVYGSSGDYLGSGIDGPEVHVHNNGQDQLGQILKSGTLVIHGDVGQTFMYGAKGGHVFVLGNAAGRPLINAVGKPRVVINGTCLDYLAESFMAGDPLDGGGFVILNGLTFDDSGRIVELEEPYPGGNLFSLASGGAIYVRDPHNQVTQGQLNGGEFTRLTEADWDLIRPYLEQNEAHFGIPIERLLKVDGIAMAPDRVFRKIRPVQTKALQADETWV